MPVLGRAEISTTLNDAEENSSPPISEVLENLRKGGRKKQRSWVSRNFLVLSAIVFTTAWLLCTYAILVASPTCDGVAWTAWYDRVLDTRLLCRPPNEVGDFFAGAFAPLAFLWLLVAVLLQRSELSEQRKELELTREVSIAQTAEAMKNVRLIEQQTRILTDQRERALLDQADRDADALLKLLEYELGECCDIQVCRREDVNDEYFFVPSPPKAGGERFQRISAYHTLMFDKLSGYDKWASSRTDLVSFYAWRLSDLERVCRLLGELTFSCTPAKQLEIEHAGVHSIAGMAGRIRDIILPLDHRANDNTEKDVSAQPS